MTEHRQFWNVRTHAAVAMVTLLFIVGSNAGAYSYNNLGEAGGWDDVEKGPSATYVLDHSDYTQDLGLSEAQISGALRSAFQTWGSVEGSTLSFTENPDLGGNYDLTDGPADSAGPPWFGGYAGDSLDQGANYLYANITFGGWLDNSYFDYLEDGSIDGVDSNILGVCWTGKVRSALSRKPRWIADIYLNDGWTWSLDGDLSETPDTFEIDIETVVLHELGHAIGLGHEDLVEAVMNPFYSAISRALYPDDEDGVRSLYTESRPKGGGRPPSTAAGQKGRSSSIYLDEYQALLATTATVLEPTTIMLLAAGMVVLVVRRRGRR